MDAAFVQLVHTCAAATYFKTNRLDERHIAFQVTVPRQDLLEDSPPGNLTKGPLYNRTGQKAGKRFLLLLEGLLLPQRPCRNV